MNERSIQLSRKRRLARAVILRDIGAIVQVLSVVIASLLAVFSFNAARVREAESRRIDSAKMFLQLRTEKYLETAKVAGILATSHQHSAEEVAAASRRFDELYWSELALVEDADVEASMIEMAKTLHKYPKLTPQQDAALNLSSVLRDSLATSWGVSSQAVGTTNR